MIGRTLSHYEILDKLGEGGMGAVYLARDTVLQRRVALKVLPAGLAHQRERLERFRQEATAVAALDHPNIVTVFSIEEAEGVHFITMQLVEGKPLSERIPPGGLALEALLAIAVPLADAVGAAHAKGVIHRDLKPANVMVTEEGRVAVLDFGLAKLQEGTRARRAESAASTVLLTREGQTPGTAAYMSPEQAGGQPLDHRSDIFSLAIVFYEMATGERPFSGTTRSELRSSIMTAAPRPLKQLRSDLPRHLGRIIRRGLEKDVGRRYQSVLDLRNDLADLRREQESGELAAGEDDAMARGRQRRWPIYLGVGVLTVVALLVGWLYRSRHDTPRPPLRALPLTSWEGSERHPALSPRGDRVAFVWDGGERRGFDLYVMLLNSGEPLRLTDGTGSIGYPAWSPDGSQIAFQRAPLDGGAQVVSMSALGGTERILWSSPESSIEHLDWSPGGELLAFVERRSATEPTRIVLLSTESGETRVLSAPPRTPGSLTDRLPAFSPDARSLAFVRWYETRRSEIYLQPLAAGEAQPLLEHDGWIEGLDWLPDSSALLFSSPWQGATGLWQTSLGGAVSQLGFGQDAGDLSIAASGDRLVFSQDLTDSNIWRVSGPTAAAVPPQRLIASTRDDWAPRYSPDGEHIALVSNRSGEFQVWVCDSEGRQCSQYVTPGRASSPCWSPDGRRLAFSQEIEGQHEVFVGDREGGFPLRLTRGDSSGYPGDWSADGRWIYYHSRHGGSDQIWRVAASGGQPQQITTGGGMQPALSDDGRIVYYVRTDPQPGIWRAAASGGSESPVLERAGLSRRGFVVRRDSLVFLWHGGDGVTTIERLDLASGVPAPVAEIAGSRQGRLSMSPDGRWIVYAQNDASGGDLILVENLSGGRGS